jgi:hypothetical protein
VPLVVVVDTLEEVARLAVDVGSLALLDAVRPLALVAEKKKNVSPTTV